jgi:hypothetical protein
LKGSFPLSSFFVGWEVMVFAFRSLALLFFFLSRALLFARQAGLTGRQFLLSISGVCLSHLKQTKRKRDYCNRFDYEKQLQTLKAHLFYL